MSNDIIAKAARIEREKARRKALSHLPAIENEVRKARQEYREASQKARGLWIRLCRRAGVPEEKYHTIDALNILQEDTLNQECRKAVLELDKKVAKLNKLVTTYQRLKGRHQ